MNIAKAKTYLRLAQDASQPKNETLAEHRKHCKAEKGKCPFEQKLDEVDTLTMPTDTQKSLDERYLTLVNAGDMARCEQMVRDRAAKVFKKTQIVDADEKPLKVFHGSGTGGFTVFNRGKYGVGMFFTPSYDVAKQYAEGQEPIPVYLNAQNLAQVDWHGDVDNDYGDGHGPILDEAADAHQDGCDGFLATNTVDSDDDSVQIDQYVVFDPNQIKSSEPVTRDDNGNVIPLSKRFDMSNPDIRY